jgi:acyl-CoA reductase-like NAD-dependent aldehyde dehydrogenase
MRVYHEEQFGPILLAHSQRYSKNWTIWPSQNYGQQVSLFGNNIKLFTTYRYFNQFGMQS